jgi:hypothetical protein
MPQWERHWRDMQGEFERQKREAFRAEVQRELQVRCARAKPVPWFEVIATEIDWPKR